MSYYVSEWSYVVKPLTADRDERSPHKWTLYHYNKVMASGEGDTYAKAEAAVQTILAKEATAAAKAGGVKMKLSQLLAQYKKTRPNLVLHVLRSLATEDMTREACADAAEAEEERIADASDDLWRVAPPKHTNALPAAEVAGRLWDAAQSAGCVGPKASRRGESLFSYWWHDEACEAGVWGKSNGEWTCIPFRKLQKLAAKGAAK